MGSGFWRVRRLLAIGGAAFTPGIAACGGDAEPTGDSAESAAETPAADAAMVYSVAVDPKDGTLLVSAGESLARLPATGGEAEPIAATISTGGADGPVKDLVLRFDESGTLFSPRAMRRRRCRRTSA